MPYMDGMGDEWFQCLMAMFDDVFFCTCSSKKRWHDALFGLVQRHALFSAVSMVFAGHQLDVKHLSCTLSTSTLRCFFLGGFAPKPLP